NPVTALVSPALARVARGVRRRHRAVHLAVRQARRARARVVLPVSPARRVTPPGAGPARRHPPRARACHGSGGAPALGGARGDRRGAAMVAGVDKLPVGAHYGLRDWLSQRVTAVVITLY